MKKDEKDLFDLMTACDIISEEELKKKLEAIKQEQQEKDNK